MSMRKKTTVVGLVAAAALALFAFAGATAANPTDVTVSATVPTMLQLDMPTTAVTFGTVNPGDPAVTRNITATINSNKAYALKVTKNHDLQNAGGTQTIPSSYLTFGATMPAGGTYNAPSGTQFGTDTEVIAGARGSGRSTTITYSLSVPWDQEPDAYTATHTYTATQP